MTRPAPMRGRRSQRQPVRRQRHAIKGEPGRAARDHQQRDRQHRRQDCSSREQDAAVAAAASASTRIIVGGFEDAAAGEFQLASSTHPDAKSPSPAAAVPGPEARRRLPASRQEFPSAEIQRDRFGLAGRAGREIGAGDRQDQRPKSMSKKLATSSPTALPGWRRAPTRNPRYPKARQLRCGWPCSGRAAPAPRDRADPVSAIVRTMLLRTIQAMRMGDRSDSNLNSLPSCVLLSARLKRHRADRARAGSRTPRPIRATAPSRLSTRKAMIRAEGRRALVTPVDDSQNRRMADARMSRRASDRSDKAGRREFQP